MLDIFQYSFMVRGFEAGIIIALIAPLIGIFLVLRRYSLIADTLAHVSLAGIAIGLILHINPFISAIISTLLSSVVIEKLKDSKRVFGESALALFLSGSLATAVVLLSFAHGFSVNLFNYLFGSITTVKQTEVYLIAILGVVILLIVRTFYKELVYITVDEEAAKVSGLPVEFINLLLIVLAALTVSLSIPIVGILLIGALIVVPVVSALQLKLSFTRTILVAEFFSVVSMILGIISSYYLNLATGGTIVIISLIIFSAVFIFKSLK